ncbi:ABC transporter ATP-binding protein [Segnochrobactrum spirostomi]|uniref:ABC transporter ATP-binding protein n=1 Tax=Segnochrobactrum spirostomi TaxID=2608987 RepID=A0A6A7YC39_9HYPH|nr:ABC transporter ATP-binding protein [Segnochrobactrum spirostomi]MQT15242.1 ABC transporter ATP-binding protein [Segnochrobactrum spirostomi]
MTIRAEHLTWKAGKTVILDGISLEVRTGEMVGLLGPNGSGKTSLLRLLAGLKRPDAGRILLDDREIGTIRRRALARRVAFVEQHATTTANLTVADVVRLGRHPHRSLLAGWTPADEDAVARALAVAGFSEKRDARWQRLSGGEKQRAQIAKALAQSPTELILDEPTNHLDIEHQIGVLRLIAGLPVTSVIALHDLNHAAMFCDRLVVLARGRVVAAGTPEDILTEDLLRSVFSVEARVAPSPHHARPHIHFLR